MIIDQELTSLELVGVHGLHDDSSSTFGQQVFSIEFRRHRTPNLGTLRKTKSSALVICKACGLVTDLDVRDVSLLCQIHPIGFVQLWTDDVIQVRDSIVLSYQSCCKTVSISRKPGPGQPKPGRLTGKTELGMGPQALDAFPESCGRRNMHLIQ